MNKRVTLQLTLIFDHDCEYVLLNCLAVQRLIEAHRPGYRVNVKYLQGRLILRRVKAVQHFLVLIGVVCIQLQDLGAPLDALGYIDAIGSLGELGPMIVDVNHRYEQLHISRVHAVGCAYRQIVEALRLPVEALGQQHVAVVAANVKLVALIAVYTMNI